MYLKYTTEQNNFVCNYNKCIIINIINKFINFKIMNKSWLILNKYHVLLNVPYQNIQN